MARLPRFFVPGYPLHVIQRGNNREAVFGADADYHRSSKLTYRSHCSHRCTSPHNERYANWPCRRGTLSVAYEKRNGIGFPPSVRIRAAAASRWLPLRPWRPSPERPMKPSRTIAAAENLFS